VAIAGVVHENVEPAEGIDRGGHGHIRSRHVGDVEREGEQRVGIARLEIGEAGGIASGRDDIVAGGEGGFSDRAAEAAGGAGDQPGLGHEMSSRYCE
jgi:hypothetical protein